MEYPIEEFERILKKLDAEALGEILEALAFYADGETYFAIGFFPDPPCGDFIEDFDEVPNLGQKPGKRARAVFKKLFEKKILEIEEDEE